MRRFAAALAILLLLLPGVSFATAPQVARGTGGAVAAAEENAARAGIEILRRGGNAADAAVAVAFALAVTWPEAGNIGGGGFWISRDANGRMLAIDFRETAPRNARRDLFIRPGRGGQPPSSTEGPLASGVPGSVDGLWRAHRSAGRLSWKTVIEPAVRLAREGFVMTETVSESIAAPRYRARLAVDPETAAIFLPHGQPPVPGTVFRQPALARTLEAIRDRGSDGFYRGQVAREIEEGQKKAGGLITRGDLALYSARVRPALRFRFGPAEIVTTPAPSSGPVLAEMAILASSLGLEKLKGRDPAASHLLVEIEKRAFHDRNRWLGDPAFPGVREGAFTDSARLRRLAATINPNRATPSEALQRSREEPPSTTHFSVVDAAGGAVSVTTTLNDSFGNARVAPGLGFLLNNEMDDFATAPGKPNLYGLIQGEVNAVAPGKRMLSAMCPSIAVIGKRNAFVWGTPGGSTIPTTNFQILLGLILRGESLEAAVAAPRFHQQDFPDKIQLERERFDSEWTDALRRIGHTVEEREPDKDPIGRVHAIARKPDGSLTAVADPRSGGVGLVVSERR
ncbi:MAG TPA: gamma-glutamyltransferase [Thermoanaerobaculia bacterium]